MNNKPSQQINRIYKMISPNERNNIINDINNLIITSECKTGQKQQWWTKKHHPSMQIPLNIYVLGDGTFDDLYDRYINKYAYISKKDFRDYTRELQKQQIMK